MDMAQDQSMHAEKGRRSTSIGQSEAKEVVSWPLGLFDGSQERVGLHSQFAGSKMPNEVCKVCRRSLVPLIPNLTTKPAEPTATSGQIEKGDYDKWITANRKSLAVIKIVLPESIKDNVAKKDTAFEYLTVIKAKFDSSKKSQAHDLINELTGARFDRVGSARVHILELVSLGNKFRVTQTLIEYDLQVGTDIAITDPPSPPDTADIGSFPPEPMNVKIAFLNGELSEQVYMRQPEGFKEKGKEDFFCMLKKSLYELKQVSQQWYLKFDRVVTSLGFEENPIDQCIYLKLSGSNFIFLVLYVDDILLVSSNKTLLMETKSFLSENFEMKDMGEASYVLGIEISHDRPRGLLGLSQ
ncbi:uncharacterized protein LOC122092995 [Macadamia integrifolia]|uniref:uncharacterized protein LOC122092995 n=1 Tax=Macadamia integrifolia TaxID=60698 RepID=UPI001C52E376|nr:uncharacterized protein LOC122092995 [Macadamia integrifolia]